MTNGNVRITEHCVRPLPLIVGMGIRQVSHCQAQPVGLKQKASDDIKQARAESCDQHGRKSTKSIESTDKTAKSIIAFDSITV